MLSRGDINHTQLRNAVGAQRTGANYRIGEWMQRLGYVTETQVTSALARQWSCPVLKALPTPLRQPDVPFHLMKKFGMLPVSFTPRTRTLHIAFADEINYPVLIAVEQMLQCATEPCLMSPAVLTRELGAMEEGRRSSEKVFDGERGPAEVAFITSSYAAKLIGKFVRVVSCAGLIWVRVGGDRGQTDLLFCPRA